MGDDDDLELLLSLNGASYEAASGLVVEFTAHRTAKTKARPHGISYALVLRPADGQPWVKFDNAHAVERPGGQHVRQDPAHDHWHRAEGEKGRPYTFTTAAALLNDFWREVKRALTEKGVPHDF